MIVLKHGDKIATDVAHLNSLLDKAHACEEDRKAAIEQHKAVCQKSLSGDGPLVEVRKRLDEGEAAYQEVTRTTKACADADKAFVRAAQRAVNELSEFDFLRTVRDRRILDQTITKLLTDR